MIGETFTAKALGLAKTLLLTVNPMAVGVLLGAAATIALVSKGAIVLETQYSRHAPRNRPTG